MRLIERGGRSELLAKQLHCTPTPALQSKLRSPRPSKREGAHFCCCRSKPISLSRGATQFFIFSFVFHVKRFHTKRFVNVNETISFTYTKFAEDHVQDILDVDPAEQPAERPSRHPQILRRQFLTFRNHRQAAL